MLVKLGLKYLAEVRSMAEPQRNKTTLAKADKAANARAGQQRKQARIRAEGGAIKCDQFEMEKRVSEVADLLIRSYTSGEIVNLIGDKYDVTPATVYNYLKKARALLVEQMNIPREEFLAELLGFLKTVARKANETDQQANAVSAAKLLAELTGVNSAAKLKNMR